MGSTAGPLDGLLPERSLSGGSSARACTERPARVRGPPTLHSGGRDLLALQVFQISHEAEKNGVCRGFRLSAGSSCASPQGLLEMFN